ncbi:MAG TPA: YifB family Mg chelatase-like AAA ATPase [Burkholderiaceae bacterium]|nr:YifB family Mg chelatase-like AAA ATPase [Burkholderiaceae bacterium]
MPLAVVHSRGLVGIDAPAVSVEVHLSRGLPGFSIVGLPDTEVKESRDRVRSALLHSGFQFPNRRITVNLAPADLPKESGRFDLPIAVGILAASAQLPRGGLDAVEMMGELSLSGQMRPIRGALVMALALSRSAPARRLILPRASAAEAAPAGYEGTRGADSLREVWAHLAQGRMLEPPPAPAPGAAPDAAAGPGRGDGCDLTDVIGQQVAKRALEVAAAGGHSVLFSGPPGTGKSMLAHRLPGLLPPLDAQAALEAAAVQSAAGVFAAERWGQRSFRAPHHTVSAVALAGGANPPKPGEVSLAHHGVLFLDELPEFRRDALEALREPLETGRVTVSRAGRSADFPARFQLVAAMNPCPCGYLGSTRIGCRCAPAAIDRYRARISGPLLDRIDISLQLPELRAEELTNAQRGEASAAVAARVAAARQRAHDRQGVINALLPAAQLERHCPLSRDASARLRQASEQLALSARGHHRTLRLARTIADLYGTPAIEAAHVTEALTLRRDLRSRPTAG